MMENDKDDSRTRVRAAKLAIAAVVGYQALLIILIFLRADLDPSWHTISEWAIGPYGWVMVLAFILSAGSYASLFVAIRPQVRGVGKVGAVFLLTCALGTFFVGVFVTDPMPIRPPLSTTGTIHVISGTLAALLLPIAALLINLSIARKNNEFAGSRRILILTAGLPLVALVGSIIHMAIFVLPLGPDAYGPGVHIGWPPRVVFLTYGLWVIAVAWQVIKISSNKNGPAK